MKRAPARSVKSHETCAGWEVVCPDGRVRHFPYHNLGDAKSHARHASDADWFAKRGCRLAPKPSRLERSQPACCGGRHTVRALVIEHQGVKSEALASSNRRLLGPRHVGSDVAKKTKASPARLDREIVKALGKKGKLWDAPEKKPRSRPTEAPTSAADTGAKTEKVCRFCGQPLHWSDGYFECGGEGNGICSYWAAIGDYDRAGRPKDVESWLDSWLHHEIGTTWAGTDWDRAKHAKAIRDYFKLTA
jgi:hypothetical protein